MICMKTIIIPNSKQMIKQALDLYDGIIIGIEEYSVNLPIYFTLEEIKEIAHDLTTKGKEVFVSINKNLHNRDLAPVTNILLELEKLPITGILYYDIALINLKEKLSLTKPLVWNQEHLTTNASTCNYWKGFGAPYTYLSSELTLQEIISIRQKTDHKLFVNIFGYLPIFHSKRHLVKNYLTTFQLKANQEQFYIEKEGKSYPIVDDTLGTTVYSNVTLNAIRESLILKKYNIDYVVFNSYHIEESLFIKILEQYKNINTKNEQERIEQINQLLKNQFDKGFFYKETIYKVKGGAS